jgi:flagellar biosynthesis protein FlhB
MSENEQSGEKSHEPTQQKLQQARDKGDVPKSNDVSAAAAYLGLMAALFAGGLAVVENAGAALTVFIAQPDRLVGLILGPGGAGLSAAMLGEVAYALLPLFAAPILLVVLSLVAQQAVAPSGDKLKPKLNRLSILANAKNKFGPTGLMEFAKAATKLAAISVVLGIILSSDLGRIIGAVRGAPVAVAGIMMDLLMTLLIATTAIATTIAVLDISWQRFDHRRKLRMTFQEMKDEVKHSEGDPFIKAQRRKRAEAIATNRMLLDVPTADVVIVNPTHYAVALKWARTPGSAPVCVAKGVDAVALKIRERAEASGVPIHSDPPSARALHATVDLGQEIHPEHYKAVAAAIRFAEALRRKEKGRS